MNIRKYFALVFETPLDIILAAVCIATVSLAGYDFAVDIAHARKPKVQVASSPAPIEMTQAEYNATLQHRDELVMERNTALAKENADLKTQLADLQAAGRATNAIVAVGPDLSKEISALNSDLAAEKRHSAWNLWKGGLIAFPLGIIAAIVGYFLTKGTVLAAKIAALA